MFWQSKYNMNKKYKGRERGNEKKNKFIDVAQKESSNLLTSQVLALAQFLRISESFYLVSYRNQFIPLHKLKLRRYLFKNNKNKPIMET